MELTRSKRGDGGGGSLKVLLPFFCEHATVSLSLVLGAHYVAFSGCCMLLLNLRSYGVLLCARTCVLMCCVSCFGVLLCAVVRSVLCYCVLCTVLWSTVCCGVSSF